MKEDKKVPQLRFPEFTDAWKQRKLREVVKEFYNGKTPYRQNKAYWGGNVNWLTSGDLNRDVVTNTIEKITEEGQKASRLRIIPKGTLVIAIMGLEAAGTRGNCGILGIDTTINQACMALIANESIATKDFLFQWYKAFGNRLALKFTQGTKQQNYNEELLGNLDISYPSLKEQQQIGAFFTQLDNTITLQQRKLNSLQKLKKGLLQKMFPKNGENIPEIRFPEFSDAWKQRKVKELCSISTGKSNTQDKVDDGEYPFYVRSPIVERSKKYLYDEEAVLTVGDGVGTGKVFHYVNGKYDLHQRCYRMFNFSEELNAKYFYHIFSKMFYKRVMSMTAKTSVDSVRMDMIADMEIPVPNIKEQEKIGAFFSDIDNLITLQQRKLESLQKLKKGLLQQMFI